MLDYTAYHLQPALFSEGVWLMEKSKLVMAFSRRLLKYNARFDTQGNVELLHWLSNNTACVKLHLKCIGLASCPPFVKQGFRKTCWRMDLTLQPAAFLGSQSALGVFTSSLPVADAEPGCLEISLALQVRGHSTEGTGSTCTFSWDSDMQEKNWGRGIQPGNTSICVEIYKPCHTMPRMGRAAEALANGLSPLLPPQNWGETYRTPEEPSHLPLCVLFSVWCLRAIWIYSTKQCWIVKSNFAFWFLFFSLSLYL